MSQQQQRRLPQETDGMDDSTAHAGMSNNGWIFSGDISQDIRIRCDLGDVEEEKVLGLSWDP